MAIINNDTESLSSDNAGSIIYERLDILPAWAARWEIEYKDLTVEDEVLGKGNFGEVRAGCMKVNDKVTKVAVKRLKGTTRRRSQNNQHIIKPFCSRIKAIYSWNDTDQRATFSYPWNLTNLWPNL